MALVSFVLWHRYDMQEMFYILLFNSLLVTKTVQNPSCILSIFFSFQSTNWIKSDIIPTNFSLFHSRFPWHQLELCLLFLKDMGDYPQIGTYLKIVESFQSLSKIACMVDRGFNVQDLLLVKQVKLYMPPFTKGQSQFTKQKDQKGQVIAKARTHVERAIERVRRFRIFNSVIPLKMKDLLDDIVLVCSALTHLMRPLIQNKGKANRPFLS